MLPDFAGSLVLNVTRQVLCRCLPTYSSFSLRRFSGHSVGVATRPPDNLVYKATSPVFVYTGHDSRETNTRRAGQEYQGLLPGLHRARIPSYVLSAWIPHVGTSLQFGFFGRCDAHGRDSSPHAGDCKGTPPPPPSLQYRRRQGTQGQRQVEAGLWTEKVGIAYN